MKQFIYILVGAILASAGIASYHSVSAGNDKPTIQVEQIAQQVARRPTVRTIQPYVDYIGDQSVWIIKGVTPQGVSHFPVEYNAERRPTGPGKLPFQTGEWVFASKIYMGGKLVHQNCWLSIAEYSGEAEDGVINPWPQELAKASPCKASDVAPSQPAQPAVQRTRVTTNGTEKPFNIGDAVAGAVIVMGGKSLSPEPCSIQSASAPGTVKYGVIHSGGKISDWAGEIDKHPPCQ